MESLTEQIWDVIIAGTSLSQSLLALALSKCDLKVLHVDQNDYYGGVDAGLSLDEAQRWVERQTTRTDRTHALSFSIVKAEDSSALQQSRAYTISLEPQIIYAKSRILPTLVSSQLHTQLEFQAVGSFFVYANDELQKIPSNREDVFADDVLSVRDKRRLMGLLRYVVEEQDQDEGVSMQDQPSTLQARLQSQFKLPDHLIAPVQALSLSTRASNDTAFDVAMARLKRHLTSMGYFGPGLAAVMAKYGGNSEIAQVACRAGAVGGFVYLLGHGIKSVVPLHEDSSFEVELSDGTIVRSKHLVGMTDDLPVEILSTPNSGQPRRDDQTVAHSISVVSSPLKPLFALASDSSNVPAVAIILVDDGDLTQSPIYLQVHSEETGECPFDQSIIHASTLHQGGSSQPRLETAVKKIISTANSNENATILWQMNYVRQEAKSRDVSNSTTLGDSDSNIIIFPERPHDLTLEDTILDDVKSAWEKILGSRSTEYDFLRFEERRDTEEED
ncbi:Rab proteins geranylgeranyltransferase component A [Lithohypha guttulata]|uniref:Rab proteins geranylgeranyltransferase n=1 Tax=Lithohypha guttulata TaxID=1690604 RepID=A0AAN7YDM6_9EURO|nr:Rab proteins geranylgeranyltransferase component A [Lithohypha guttulata]